MAKVELKQPIVDEIKAQLDGAKSMVVVDYRGISVADVTELRKPVSYTHLTLPTNREV